MADDMFFSGFLGKRVHLGVCGSIAAYKALDLMRELQRHGVAVSVTLTEATQRFVTRLAFEALGAEVVHTGMFDPEADIYSHLAPGRSAQCLAVIPATANTIAKMAHGLADDMLSTQALSFPGPVVLAPAMNPNLWNATATQRNVDTLLDRGVDVVFPGSGSVACGDEGKGRLAESEEILARILKAISPQDLLGKRVLVTLGPTREFFDPVRFWSNPSTGRMGGCLATAAWLRGAEVTVVAGPCDVALPQGVRTVDVISARQMHDAALVHFADCDIACATAAVADFAPKYHGDHKFKKSDHSNEVSFAFERNPDILAEMGKRKSGRQILIGFAAETNDHAEQALGKLRRKALDMIICNDVGSHEGGFASVNNRVMVLDASGRRESWPLLPKTEVAWRIWDHLLLTSA